MKILNLRNSKEGDYHWYRICVEHIYIPSRTPYEGDRVIKTEDLSKEVVQELRSIEKKHNKVREIPYQYHACGDFWISDKLERAEAAVCMTVKELEKWLDYE